MKRAIPRILRLVLRVYPARWRRRYGAEFDALLENVDPGWRDLPDLFWGALKMQASTWKFATIVAAFGFAGVILAGAVSLTMPDQYESTAFLLVRSLPAGVTEDRPLRRIEQATQRALTKESLVKIMEDQHLYERERAAGGLDGAVDKMRQDISIQAQSAHVFDVSFASENAARAQRVTAELLTRLIDDNLRNAESEPAHPLQVVVEVLDAPTLPLRPVRPKRAPAVAFGLFAGLLLGTLVAAFRPRAPQPAGS
jgi:uncharacterized protein involved in exopolysaccharide biosynthesis